MNDVDKITNDAINPNHYRRGNDVQLIELIRLTPFSLGNAIKYCYRNGAKNTDAMVQDLQKALWYLNDYHQHSHIMYLSNINLLRDLREVVFSTLPEWERQICSMIVDYYIMNVMTVNGEVTGEEGEKYYGDVVENIVSHIEALS